MQDHDNIPSPMPIGNDIAHMQLNYFKEFLSKTMRKYSFGKFYAGKAGTKQENKIFFGDAEKAEKSDNGR
jgi:hypothetical protein